MVSASMLLGQLEPLHWEDAKGVGLISSCERSSPLLEFWAHQRARIDERREELLHLRGNVDATDGHADDHAEKEWDELRCVPAESDRRRRATVLRNVTSTGLT
mmetsp:Transcript_15931/g.32022  ORF Transcript_15931/g.32022 Transcript_15931/m.32022 type:complete len:103 (+) Transcript_15931:237-545(+)